METELKVAEMMQTITAKESVAPTDSLQADLSLDSLGMVTLLVEVEDTFGITLEESDMNPFDLMTVGDVIRLVGKYVGGTNE